MAFGSLKVSGAPPWEIEAEDSEDATSKSVIPDGSSTCCEAVSSEVLIPNSSELGFSPGIS